MNILKPKAKPRALNIHKTWTTIARPIQNMITNSRMLNGTFKVNNNLTKMIHFIYLKIDNRHNLIKKSLHMIYFRLRMGSAKNRQNNKCHRKTGNMKQPITIYLLFKFQLIPIKKKYVKVNLFLVMVAMFKGGQTCVAHF